MSAKPHDARPRCLYCKGRRVIVDPVTDPVRLVPCPWCSHRGPPAVGRRVEPVDTMARAA